MKLNFNPIIVDYLYISIFLTIILLLLLQLLPFCAVFKLMAIRRHSNLGFNDVNFGIEHQQPATNNNNTFSRKKKFQVIIQDSREKSKSMNIRAN